MRRVDKKDKTLVGFREVDPRFVADLFGLAKFPAEWSLAITFAILASGVLYSLWRTRAARPLPTQHGDS